MSRKDFPPKSKSILTKEMVNEFIQKSRAGARVRVEEFDLPSLGGSIKIAPPQLGKMALIQKPMFELVARAKEARSQNEDVMDAVDFEELSSLEQESNIVLVHLCLVEPELSMDETREFLMNLPGDEAQQLISRCQFLSGTSPITRRGAENFFASRPV